MPEDPSVQLASVIDSRRCAFQSRERRGFEADDIIPAR
jgi:hypothetical protein